METRTVPIEGPLDLRETLRPLHGHFRDDGWWLAARTPSGSGSLRIRRTREDLIGEAWGDGAEWLLNKVDRIAGLHDDPSSLVTDDPIVRELHRTNPGLRFGATGLVFDSLVVGILGQKVTGREAALALKGLYRKYSDPAPGPDSRLRLPPDPGRIARAPYYDLHELHLEKKRADVLIGAARHAGQIDALAAVDPGEAASALLAYPGIGEWTVAGTLTPSHGDVDRPLVGDFHLKHIVVYHLTGRPRGTDEEMLELLEPFRPQRGRVARLLTRLGPEPKFGPRANARDITGM